MFSRRKIKKIFPLDFYGEESGWRFIIRAQEPSEVLDAMYWRAYITCHRKKVDLIHLATDKFNYRYNYSTGETSDMHFAGGTAPIRVNMMGPIVPISAIMARVEAGDFIQE
ncbi:hypothetical protein A3K86_19780 [Photobacterium jeanii]|uniref:Uncharacterized protein n=1 Tax=Photobacterium jeanii TaxID=858640 RepID=A0A178K4R2_9GAMM|nr:hypothetical protein [Photobacterium jeanii]OAN11702.1 hypothetical protein A3K86_19780 [Photobacterium jeanii]PST90720.1 hypothetical protein C9I91_08880 [Photobacterium jeanii]